jgi:hypothetical protein
MITTILKQLSMPAVFCFIATISLAQEKVASLTSVKAGMVGISLVSEFAIGKVTTVQVEAGVLSGRIGYSSSYGWDNDLPLGISVAPQFYYNYAKRGSLNRNTENNSANYISLPLLFNSSKSVGDRSSSQAVALIPTWGMRRSLGSKLYFDFSVGYGARYFFENKLSSAWEGVPNLSAKFGLVLK